MTSQKIDLALAFLQSQPASAAAVLEQQPVKSVSEFLQDVPYNHAAAVLRKMLPQYSARICNNLEPAVSASFLSKLEVSLVAAIMRHSDKGLNKKVLELLPERTKIACKLLLTYAEDAVGAWMVANITTLPDDCTVEEALSRLTSDATGTDVVYVVDRERRLQGLVSVVNLLRTSPNTLITKVMKIERDSISGRTALISAANHSIWSYQDTVAVRNRNNQMVGALRHVDLRKGLDNISSNTSSNIPKLNGSDPLTGICEVYGSSLLGLFSTISETASTSRLYGEQK